MQGILQRKGLPAEEVGTATASGAADAHRAAGHHSSGAEAIAADEHTGHGVGFTGAVAATIQNVVRYGPLIVALFALLARAVDRRRRAAGLARVSPVPSRVWQGAAVGGLLASAVLHIGLTPARLREGAAFAGFFIGASLGLAAAAATLLVWPSRRAAMAGMVLTGGLLVVYVVFRLVPPPGTAAAEAVDSIGIATKLVELVALGACGMLWYTLGRYEELSTIS